MVQLLPQLVTGIPTIPSDTYEIEVAGATYRYIKLHTNGAVEVEKPSRTKEWKDKLCFSEFINSIAVAEAIAQLENKKVYPCKDETTQTIWAWKVR